MAFDTSKMRGTLRIVLIILFSFGLGSIFILMIGENPLQAFPVLFRGAFRGKLNLGTTLAYFTPLLLTSLAFAIGAKGGAFNVGIEGEVYLGGLTAAYIGIHWGFLPMPLHLLACFAGALIVAALWALIPGLLKAYFKINEVCTTILFNYVALYITSYFVSGPMSAGAALSKSFPVEDQVRLHQFMRPSSANIGILIAIATAIVSIWIVKKTTFGYQMRTVGSNPEHAEFAGINPKLVFIKTMMFSGALGGIVGCIQILGVYGFYLDNFASGLGFNGMLTALIVKNNVFLAPVMSFFFAALQSGSLGLQQVTDIPKSIIDTIMAIIIVVATMEHLFLLKKKKKSLGTESTAEAK